MLRVSLCVFLLSIITVNFSHGQDYTATGGDWTSAASWGGAGPPSAPGDDGTTILIPAGVTITIPAFTAITFNGTIEIYGTLTIGFLGTLNMDATSTVQIYTNGTINGFLSAVIIDGTIVGTIPALNGPQAIDNTGEGQPLPVELIFFNANTVNNHVDLSWATAQEENFDYFSIERSSNGSDFIEIAQVNGTGNSTARIDYDFRDEFPLIGISYYRLTSVDFDGYTEVFEYALVNVDNAKNDFIVFPNPVEGGEFSLQTNFAPEAPLDLVIYNNVGRVEGQYKVTDWHNLFETNNLQAGSYLLKLATPSGVIVKRILIR